MNWKSIASTLLMKQLCRTSLALPVDFTRLYLVSHRFRGRWQRHWRLLKEEATQGLFSRPCFEQPWYRQTRTQRNGVQPQCCIDKPCGSAASTTSLPPSSRGQRLAHWLGANERTCSA